MNHLLLLSVLLWAMPVAAQSRFALKPVGGSATPLRLKSLQANVSIRGQFAQTRMLLTFQNESYRRMEADFYASLPAHATPTGFAYWFGKEKVIARIVEKERAAQIYQAITRPQRDPALVEFLNKNTLRARIFPVEPNSDLKIEMQLVQVLPSDRQGAAYVFPLAPAKAGTGTLDELDVNVAIQPDAHFVRLSNNFRLPVARQKSGVLRLRLQRKKFRPTRDWRIAQIYKPQSLRVSAFTARAGGTDGFFALALTPNRTLRRPKISIRGVRTYDVLPARLPVLRAGRVLIVCGKYRGAGNATIALQNGRLSARAVFSDRREPQNLASKLWAAKKLEALSHAKQKTTLENRAKIVRLSTQFTIPSLFTSWLAVPESELKDFQEEKAEIDLTFYATQIARLLRAGKGHSADARDLKTRFAQVARVAKRDPKYELKYRLGSVMDTLQEQIATEKSKGKKADKRKIAGLQRDIETLRKAGALNHEIVRQEIYDIEGKLLLAQREVEQMDAGAPGRAPLQAKIKTLDARYNELLNAPAPPSRGWGGGGGFQSGDPLLKIEAPADAVRVVAIFPDNTTRALRFDAASQSWQLRFDIPTHAEEGEYSVGVVIVLRDGTRRTLKFTYRVDLTSPAADGKAAIVSGESTPQLRLELETDGATRVEAILPWNEKLALQPSQQKPNAFFALAAVPRDYSAEKFAVTYLVTDAAHNRTTLTIDVTK